MRDFLAIVGVCLLASALLFATGCTGNPSCPLGCCDGTCCPDCPGCCCPCDPSRCGPGQLCCPGGICPLPARNTEVGSIEIGDADNADVNREALNERKDGPGPCANCPSCIVMPPQPSVTYPTATSRPVKIPAAAAESEASPVATGVRTGAFRCEGCQRAVVGAEWHEMWADDDTPMTCLCKQCWRSKSATEKRDIMTVYLERSNLPPSPHFHAEQLISSIR